MNNSDTLEILFVNDVNEIEKGFFLLFTFILTILCITWNFSVIILIISNKEIRKSLDNISLMIIFNYFGVSVSFFIFQILREINLLLYTLTSCIFLFILPYYIVLISQFSMFGIFLNRYLLIRFPLKYNYDISNKMSLIFIVFILIISFTISFAPFIIHFGKRSICNSFIFLNDFIIIIRLTFTIIPFLLCFIFYILILKITKQQVTSLENQTHTNQSVSTIAKLTFIKFIILLISWTIFIIFFHQLSKNLNLISVKISLTIIFIVMYNIFLKTTIIVSTNATLKSILLSKISCCLRHFQK